MSDDEEYEYTYSDDENYVYAEGTAEDLEGSKFYIPDCGYLTLQYTEVLPMMEALIIELSDLFQIDRDEAQILLRHSKWNKEIVVDKYYSEHSHLTIEAGISPPLDSEEAESPLPKSCGKSEGDTICRICYSTPTGSDSEMIGLKCGHLFCRECYGYYLETQITDGPSCVSASCPEHKCALVVPWKLFQDLTSPESFEKYVMYQTRNFIETSGTMRWCPSPGCTGVIAGRGVGTVECSCHCAFCFRCGLDGHDPCSCEQVRLWDEKCSTESLNATWIVANTKKCPKCDARIEKNQGCMHMTCRICRHGFCWTCLKPWAAEGHTWNHADCNKYSPERVEEKKSVNQCKAVLERYIHYFERYHGHDTALKFASKQREKAEAQMVALGKASDGAASRWTDVEFLMNAVEQVIACRRVLKYSYVFGYYLRDGTTEKQLFEHHQQILEKHTEELSGFTENFDATSSDSNATENTESEEVENPAVQCVNLTRTTEKFMRSLLSELSDDRFSREELKQDFSPAAATSNDNEVEAYIPPAKRGRRGRHRGKPVPDPPPLP